MIQVYTPRQLPCDGGASKLHGHPQSQLHSPRRDPDIRHFEAMNETVPRKNGPRTIKDAGRFATRYGSSVVVEPPSPPAGAPIAASAAAARATRTPSAADPSMLTPAPKHARRGSARSP